jgi:hypothetical protein
MTFFFLYKTTWQPTGEFYCGMHKTEQVDDGYLGSGLRLIRKLKKHGRNGFTREILSFHSSFDELKQAERELITKEMLQNPLCLNLVIGGLGGIGPGLLGTKLGAARTKWLWKNDPLFRERQLRIVSAAGRVGCLHPISREAFSLGAKTAQTPEAKRSRIETMKVNQHQQGARNSQFGTTCISHSEHGTKRVTLTEVESWLEAGWVRGSNIGTCFIHHLDHEKAKLVPQTAVEDWVAQGWARGMKPRRVPDQHA